MARLYRRNSSKHRMPGTYRSVPELGTVKLTAHVYGNMEKHRISKDEFERVLLEPIREDIPDGMNVVRRERDGIRLIIQLKPYPDSNTKLVTTVYRVDAQETVRR